MMQTIKKTRKVLYKYLIDQQLFIMAGLVLGMVCVAIYPPLYDLFAQEWFFVGPLPIMLKTIGQWGVMLLITTIIMELVQGLVPERGKLSKKENREVVFLSILSAFGGVIAPVLVYLALVDIIIPDGVLKDQLTGAWPIVCATDIVFAILLARWFKKKNHKNEAFYLELLAVGDDVIMLLLIVIGGAVGWFISHSPHLSTAWLVGSIVWIVLVFVRGIILRKTKTHYSEADILLLIVLTFITGYFMELLGLHGVLASIIVFSPMMRKEYMKVRKAKGDETSPQESSIEEEFLDIPDHAHKENVEDPISLVEETMKPVTQTLLFVFGFTSAVPLTLKYFAYPLPWIIVASVVVGKLLGIVSFHKLFAWLRGYKEKLDITFIGLNAGVGFTVAIFVAQLLLSGEVLKQAILGCVLTFPSVWTINIIISFVRKYTQRRE